MARELENLVQQWSERRGLEPAALGEDGKHYYVFDGDYEVALSQLGPNVYFEAVLGSLPVQANLAEDLLVQLMKLQLARSRDAAEVLTLSPEGDELMLFHVLAVERLDLRRFEAALGAFVNTAAFWARKLGEEGQRGPVPPPVMQIMYP